jgi:hypothetical protein
MDQLNYAAGALLLIWGGSMAIVYAGLGVVCTVDGIIWVCRKLASRDNRSSGLQTKQTGLGVPSDQGDSLGARLDRVERKLDQLLMQRGLAESSKSFAFGALEARHCTWFSSRADCELLQRSSQAVNDRDTKRGVQRGQTAATSRRPWSDHTQLWGSLAFAVRYPVL